MSPVTRRGAGLGALALAAAAAGARADATCPSDDGFLADPLDLVLTKQAFVDAKVDRVWRAWTTSGGIKSFLGVEARIELRIGGAYEIYFSPEAPPGLRGSEGAKVLSYLPGRMLSFSWNAPPKFGPLRDRRTWVVVDFARSPEGGCGITLSHLGWGRTPEWEALYQYFDRAWATVLIDSAKIGAA